MPGVNDLISALSDGDMVRANDTFNSVMADKMNDALDDAKIQLAQSMLGTEESEEGYDPADDDEVEYDNEYDEDDDEV